MSVPGEAMLASVNRTASVPNLVMTSMGSTTLPLVLVPMMLGSTTASLGRVTAKYGSAVMIRVRPEDARAWRESFAAGQQNLKVSIVEDAELEPRGYEVLLGTTQYREDVETRLIATFLGWFPAGLIVAGIDHAPVTRQRLTSAVATGVPVVEYLEMTDTPIDINVGFSHRAVGEAAARFFAAKGYRHIAYAGTLGSLDKRASRRVAGFQKVLHSMCLPSHYVLLSEEPFSFFVGARVFAQLIDTYPMIEAIFFANDDLAAGALGVN